MKLQRLAILALPLVLGGLLPSCSEGDSTPSRSQGRGDSGSEGQYAYSSQIGSLDQAPQEATRYLGRGFNLLKYDRRDPQGVTLSDALDLKRIQARDPWNPFSEVRSAEPTAPELEEKDGPSQPFSRQFSGRASEDYQGKLTFPLGPNLKTAVVDYSLCPYTTDGEGSWAYHSTYGLKYKTVSWIMDSAKDYGAYLSQRFVHDLSRLRASDLIAKYGTHIVTSYSLGAIQDLLVLGSARAFSKSDIEAIHASILAGKNTSTTPSLRKALSQSNQLGIIYKQAGSAYAPPSSFYSPSLFFRGDTDTTPLDQARFLTEASKAQHAFFELEGSQVPIPNLISDVPLKIKYICGILDQLRPGQRAVTDYVLCDPVNYRPVLKDRKPLTVVLGRYEDAQVHVSVGDNPFASIQDPSASRQRSAWRAELEASGLWLIKSLEGEKYLCRDLQLRSAQEDSTGQRYWLLNPIPYSATESNATLARLLIQPL